MSQALAEIVLSIEDLAGGQPLTPKTVDLPTLRTFLEEIETFIKGDQKAADLSDSRLQIRKGSVKIKIIASALLVTGALEDVAKLRKTGDLSVIQPKRAEVIEKWQGRAHRLPHRSYSVGSGSGRERIALKITEKTRFKHINEGSWIDVEKYLSGKVVDIGGKQNPNIHLVLSESLESIRINATEQQLESEEKNRIYREVTLRVSASQNIHTRELKDLRLIAFLNNHNEVDEDALARLWENGRGAWRGVKSASAWVEKLRGR